MKKVILAKHTGKTSDQRIRHWKYDMSTIHYWDSDVSNFAIVESDCGYQLVKIVGLAEVSDEVEAEKRVISFLNNDNFPKEGQ
jgi:hypothetical protein